MLALLLTLAAAPLQSDASVLHVRASVAFAPCIAPVVKAYSRRLRGRGGARRGRCRIAAGDADVVIGDDSEMTRLLEGGTASSATAIDLGSVPWVFVGGSPTAASASASGAVTVLGGVAGREARTLLVGDGRDAAARDDGRGGAPPRRRSPSCRFPSPARETHRPADVTPLLATAAEIARLAQPRRVPAASSLSSARAARPLVDRCLRRGAPVAAATPSAAAMDVYGRAVVDWWLPQCSLTRNGHNDPQQSIGPPDAVRLGADRYRGLISLGQGGYVTVELAEPAADGPGADIRVFQTTTNEPVTVYASRRVNGAIRPPRPAAVLRHAHPGRVLEPLRLRPPRRRTGARPDTSRSRTARSIPAWPEARSPKAPTSTPSRS